MHALTPITTTEAAIAAIGSHIPDCLLALYHIGARHYRMCATNLDIAATARRHGLAYSQGAMPSMVSAGLIGKRFEKLANGNRVTVYWLTLDGLTAARDLLPPEANAEPLRTVSFIAGVRQCHA